MDKPEMEPMLMAPEQVVCALVFGVDGRIMLMQHDGQEEPSKEMLAFQLQAIGTATSLGDDKFNEDMRALAKRALKLVGASAVLQKDDPNK